MMMTMVVVVVVMMMLINDDDEEEDREVVVLMCENGEGSVKGEGRMMEDDWFSCKCAGRIRETTGDILD